MAQKSLSIRRPKENQEKNHVNQRCVVVFYSSIFSKHDAVRHEAGHAGGHVNTNAPVNDNLSERLAFESQS